MAQPWEYQPEPSNYVMASSVNTEAQANPTFYTEDRPNYVEMQPGDSSYVSPAPRTDFFALYRPKSNPVWMVVGVAGVLLGIGLVVAVAAKK